MKKSRTVLLVDDNHDIIHGAQMRLRAAGYRTILANDGQQCLDAANEHTPDAIVLDVRMPGKSGLEVLVDLQQGENTSRIPVVMLSASLVDQQAALDAGAKFFLSKPYQGQNLVDTLGVAMRENTVCNQPDLAPVQ